ncbi:hypothetical protein C2G38_2169711 [Gigaspora rosea]|uniref:Helicase C-terminal domain-containing protein n=1 Tax=Gigaspora rosea TaxID=44941 RepID=A0A397VQI4_9GLOM|nr:hypothetical protein C2G38_2169711 [Gigaspora rosea]
MFTILLFLLIIGGILINVKNLYLETRSQQAKLFNDPSSGFDIQMLNEYDEIGVRYIPIPQIKQIIGRAGRFGTENAK